MPPGNCHCTIRLGLEARRQTFCIKSRHGGGGEANLGFPPHVLCQEPHEPVAELGHLLRSSDYIRGLRARQQSAAGTLRMAPRQAGRVLSQQPRARGSPGHPQRSWPRACTTRTHLSRPRGARSSGVRVGPARRAMRYPSTVCGCARERRPRRASRMQRDAPASAPPLSRRGASPHRGRRGVGAGVGARARDDRL